MTTLNIIIVASKIGEISLRQERTRWQQSQHLIQGLNPSKLNFTVKTFNTFDNQKQQSYTKTTARLSPSKAENTLYPSLLSPGVLFKLDHALSSVCQASSSLSLSAAGENQ